jgi:hypothetical protein
MPRTKKQSDLSNDNLVSSLLSKGKKTKISSQRYEPPVQKPRKQVSFSPNINSGNNSQIISNFHKAINSTNSDDIILKMLDLKEKDIVVFYKNLEKLIGKDMSSKIKNEMAGQLMGQKQQSHNVSVCPFCLENKSNCVILLCGHMLCSKCAKNINRCKMPCPKCKKPIKFIQYIADI